MEELTVNKLQLLNNNNILYITEGQQIKELANKKEVPQEFL